MNTTSHTRTPSQEKWLKQYGPWAIITGASDGIGQEIARNLAERGLNVVLVARRRHQLDALAGELVAKHGIQTRTLPLDLSRSDAVSTLFESTEDLDIGLLVAAAGFGTTGAFIDANLTTELNMLTVNCGSVVEMTYHFARKFVNQNRGGIILFSSIVAFQGVPNSAHYAATKAYIQSLAEGLRHELAPYGVDILASAPGPVHTGFATRADMKMGLALQPSTVAKVTLAALGRKTTVRPGWLTKVLSSSLAMLPRWGRVYIMRQVMRDMTKHQTSAQKEQTRATRSLHPGSVGHR